MSNFWVECIGIIGTLFVVLSFLTNNESSIRIWNSIGSVVFIFYGILLGSVSMIILNTIVIIINIRKLLAIKNGNKSI